MAAGYPPTRRTLPEERSLDRIQKPGRSPSVVRMVLTSLHIPEAQLYVSEPPPQMFGNSANEKDALWTNANWLKSRFHFSFAEYRNPKNTQFGESHTPAPAPDPSPNPAPSLDLSFDPALSPSTLTQVCCAS